MNISMYLLLLSLCNAMSRGLRPKTSVATPPTNNPTAAACSPSFIATLRAAAMFGDGFTVEDVSHLQAPGSPVAFRHVSQERKFDNVTLEDPTSLLRYELLSAAAAELGYRSPSAMRSSHEPLEIAFKGYRAGVNADETAALAYVLHGFAERTSLRTMTMSHCRVMASTLSPLCAVLPRCHSLHTLDLSWNRIGRMSAAQSSAMQRQNAEKEARMFKADIAAASDDPASAKNAANANDLADVRDLAISVRRQEDTLSLEWASEAAALHEIFDAIANCLMLRVLDLRGNGICAVGAAVLSETVLRSTSITDLNLSYNQLREVGG